MSEFNLRSNQLFPVFCLTAQQFKEQPVTEQVVILKMLTSLLSSLCPLLLTESYIREDLHIVTADLVPARPISTSLYPDQDILSQFTSLCLSYGLRVDERILSLTDSPRYWDQLVENIVEEMAQHDSPLFGWTLANAAVKILLEDSKKLKESAPSLKNLGQKEFQNLLKQVDIVEGQEVGEIVIIQVLLIMGRYMANFTFNYITAYLKSSAFKRLENQCEQDAYTSNLEKNNMSLHLRVKHYLHLQDIYYNVRDLSEYLREINISLETLDSHTQHITCWDMVKHSLRGLDLSQALIELATAMAHRKNNKFYSEFKTYALGRVSLDQMEHTLNILKAFVLESGKKNENIFVDLIADKLPMVVDRKQLARLLEKWVDNLAMKNPLNDSQIYNHAMGEEKPLFNSMKLKCFFDHATQISLLKKDKKISLEIKNVPVN